MGWTEEALPEWIGREAESETPVEAYTSEDWVWTALLVERSVDLQQADPGSRLRIEIAEAIDRHSIGQCVDFLSFGDGVIQTWELPIPAEVGSAVACASTDLVEHTHVDLCETLASLSHWGDGPEFFVLLCSAHIEIDSRLLYADSSLDSDYADPHWPIAPPTDPSLTIGARTVYDEHGDPVDRWDPVERPGGRYHACFVIASIGGEPSPKLRHLAELSGGVALPVRDAEEAEAFAAACRQRFRAVVSSVDARLTEDPDFPAGPGSSDPASPDEPAAPTPDACFAGPEAELLAEQASIHLAIEDALSKGEDHEPGAEEFIHVDVLVERSVASVAADPAGSTRRAVVDALHERNVGRSRSLSTYGWGLISTHGLRYDEDFQGPIREALREPNAHTRVDLGRACRQLQSLSGPEILIVLATSLVEPFDVATTGAEHDDGSGIDYSTWEPVGDSQRYEKDLEGRYPTVVLLGGLDGAVRPELAEWAESTSGVAMSVRSPEEIDAFAQRCAEVYRELVAQIDAECTAGLLDLDRLYG